MWNFSFLTTIIAGNNSICTGSNYNGSDNEEVLLNKVISLLCGIIFGIGLTISSMTNPEKVRWGAVGLCPGPAIASLAFLNFYSIIFVASMVFGFFTLKFFDKLN